MKNINKLGFVILHYKTLDDTLKLIESIKQQVWKDRISLYIVENGSDNDSLEKLQSLSLSISFTLIVSDVNLGFAKGNNLGIDKAISDGCDYVICSNNDVVITKQDDFLDIIFANFLSNINIAIIAPQIIDISGNKQNPLKMKRFSYKEIIFLKLFFLTGFSKLYFWLRMNILYSFILYLAKIRQSRKKIKKNNELNKIKSYIYAMHGSFIVFTPTYFKYFNGFDPNTFLYCEELIIAERILDANQKILLDNSIIVQHNESVSTKLIMNDEKMRVAFTLKHMFKSCEYFTRRMLK